METNNCDDIEQILEEIDSLEEIIIQYDQSINERNHDRTLIHTIFRNAHNLKSCLNLSGETELSEIIHLLETNFDLIRNGFLKGTNEVIDLSLQSVDFIRKNLTTKQPLFIDTASQIKYLLQSFASKRNQDKVKHPINFKLTQKEEDHYFQAIQNNHQVFLIEKNISSQLSLEDFNNLPIFEDIKNIGKLIAVSHNYENIPKTNPFTLIQLLFESKKNEEEISNSIFDPFYPAFLDNIIKKPKVILNSTDNLSFNEIAKIFQSKYQIEILKEKNHKKNGDILIESLEFQQLGFFLNSQNFKNVKKDFKKLIIHTHNIPEVEKNHISSLFSKTGLLPDQKPAAILNKGNHYFFILNNQSPSGTSV